MRSSMPRSVVAGPLRRLLIALPIVAMMVASLSMSAAAWGPQKVISDTQLATDMYDNDLVTQEGGHLHFLFDTEDGPTYQQADPDGTTFDPSKTFAYTAAYGEAEGIASDGTLLVALYRDEYVSNKLEIRRSASGGFIWTAAQIIASNSNRDGFGNGAVAVSGSTVLV